MCGSVAALLGAATLAGAILLYDVWHKGNPLGPLLMGICRALVYVTSALAVARGLSPPVVAGALALLSYLISLTYVAKQESLGRIRNLWPLAFLGAPFVYAASAVSANVAGAVLYAILLAWVLYALRLVVRRISIPRAVVRLIAGIALVDALLIAHAGFSDAAWMAALGLPLTLLLQRVVRGT
jgi:hypothetical protein